MITDLQDATLALQHYYEVDAISRRDVLGTTYTAIEQPFARPVRIWVLDKLVALGAGPELTKRLEEAACRGSRLEARSNAKVIDLGRIDDDIPFVVTEQIVGRTLREHIALTGPLSAGESLRVVEQITQAIEDAHQAGIYRLGLDTSRIFVVDSATMEIRVVGHGVALSRREMLALEDVIVDLDMVRHVPPADFLNERGELATSREIDEITLVHDGHNTIIDEDSTDVGPEPRREPSTEVVEPDPLADTLDPAQAGAPDLYALAAIAYECLSGFHPYFRDDRDVGDGLLAILRESPANLADLFDVPPGLSETVHDALGRNPRERFDTVADFAFAARTGAGDDAIQECEAMASPRWLREDAAPEATRSRSRRTKRGASPALVKALMVMVVALGCATVFAFYAGSTRDVAEWAEVPEYVAPTSDGDGVDLVIEAVTPVDPSNPFSAAVPTSAELYLVSTRGEMSQIASTPFVLKNQPVDAKLRFVLAGENIEPHQFDVLVRDNDQATMYLSERIYPIDGSLAAGSAPLDSAEVLAFHR